MDIYANNLFSQNKYYNKYLAIIAKARLKTYDGYSEVHHIIPGSLGGTDDPDNLVRLSYREHFICHWLLIKFVRDPEDKIKMILALRYMTFITKKSKRIVSSWQFDVAKRLAKDNMSGENNPAYGKKWYNNGTEAIFLADDQEIPEGFVLGKLPVTEETRRKLRDKKWYNNGTEAIFVSSDHEIPEGFTRGRLPTSEDSKLKMKDSKQGKNLGKKWYNNGIKSIMISDDKDIPKGFAPGGISRSEETRRKMSGKKWYNNGDKDILISNDFQIPEGFVLGRLPSSDETRRKISDSSKGRNLGKKYYNNGIKSISLTDEQEVPEGFVPGMLPRSK
jgi:hypothetical protein